MENTNRKYTLSRNMGFITGPLILLLGIFGYVKKVNPTFSIVIIILGVIRIGLTIFSYVLSKKENQNQG